MPWELETPLGARYRLPASISPVQLHVGGKPDQRFVRAYGSEQWFTVLDGAREPTTFDLAGILATDRDYARAQLLQNELQNAVGTAARLVEVDSHGDVAVLDLFGALPVTIAPEGVDGTSLHVHVRLIPAASDWRDP